MHWRIHKTIHVHAEDVLKMVDDQYFWWINLLIKIFTIEPYQIQNNNDIDGMLFIYCA